MARRPDNFHWIGLTKEQEGCERTARLPTSTPLPQCPFPSRLYCPRAMPARSWFDAFVCPEDLDTDTWQAFRAHVDRMQDARERQDLRLAVGCAKELCESLSRIVLSVRGESYPANGSYSGLVAAAHRAIGQHPGIDLAGDELSRKVAQSAMGLVSVLGQLRNDFGTGHGSANLARTTVDHAELSCDAAEVWCRWVLRRLPHYIHGDINAIVTRLRTGTWYGNDLADRLAVVDWRRASPEDQRRLGVAVGHRALSHTFLVQHQGVHAMHDQPARFSNEYRLGVVSGLLFSVDGTLTTTVWGVENAAKTVAVADDPLQGISILDDQAADSRWQPPPDRDAPTLEEIIDVAQSCAHLIGGDAADSWRKTWRRVREIWIEGHPF